MACLLRSRILFVLIALLVLVVLTACERRDATHTTSPSARLMVGTTTGNVAYAPMQPAPEPVEAPEGWGFKPGNARFEDLENGTSGLFVVGEYETQPGYSFEVWLTDGDGVVARWTGGVSRRYNGVVCWQQRLAAEDGSVALPIVRAAAYDLTIAFRNPVDGSVVVAGTLPVRNDPPLLSAPEPGADSEVFRDLLGCPRGS